jgi:hypothetical protein
MQQRLLRLVLPVDLIDRIDAVVTDGFGYRDFNAFVVDALEQRLLELEHEETPGMASPATLARTPSFPAQTRERFGLTIPSQAAEADRELAAWELPDRPVGVEETALRVPPKGVLAPAGEYEIRDEPLFGVHNRDYPSLWAAQELCGWTGDAPLPLSRFHARVKEAALEYGAALERLEEELGVRLTALFPSPGGSAGEAFRAYAVGSATRGADGVRMAGPLYAWGLARVWEERRRLVIAPTEDCYGLLEALEGMTVMPPHEEKHAWAFWSHVRRNAPRDFAGLWTLLRTSAAEASRKRLEAAFAELVEAPSANTVRSVAQGYVSRAREWDLLEPDLRDGRYVLTDLGERLLTELDASGD